MKETGKDKIQEICAHIRKEALELGKQQATEVTENAVLRAAEIVREATEEAEKIKKEALAEVKKKKHDCETALQSSCRQAIEMLKQKVEEELFTKGLADLISKEMVDKDLIKKIVESFMRSLEEHGIEEDFEVEIPKSIKPRDINTLLASQIIDRLKGGSVQVGEIDSGVQLRMEGRKILIDVSDKVLLDLVAAYIRRDFRDLVFQR